MKMLENRVQSEERLRVIQDTKISKRNSTTSQKGPDFIMSNIPVSKTEDNELKNAFSFDIIEEPKEKPERRPIQPKIIKQKIARKVKTDKSDDGL